MTSPILHPSSSLRRRKDRTHNPPVADRIRRRLLSFCLAAGLGLAGSIPPAVAEPLPGPAATVEFVRMPESDSSSRFLMLSVPLRPPPTGGFPTILLIPDTDGPGPRTDAYAIRLLENGFAVAESYLGSDLPGRFMPEVTETLASDPRLDPVRLAAVALGAGARIALREWAAGGPIAALALLYPGCDAELTEVARHAVPAATDTAMLLLHGAADAANPPEACAALAEALAGTARPFHQVLPGATYAWDATHLVAVGAALRAVHPAAPDGPRVLARPDARATLVAIDRVIAFLLGAPGLASH